MCDYDEDKSVSFWVNLKWKIYSCCVGTYYLWEFFYGKSIFPFNLENFRSKLNEKCNVQVLSRTKVEKFFRLHQWELDCSVLLHTPSRIKMLTESDEVCFLWQCSTHLFLYHRAEERRRTTLVRIPFPFLRIGWACSMKTRGDTSPDWDIANQMKTICVMGHDVLFQFLKNSFYLVSQNIQFYDNSTSIKIQNNSF